VVDRRIFNSRISFGIAKYTYFIFFRDNDFKYTVISARQLLGFLGILPCYFSIMTILSLFKNPRWATVFSYRKVKAIRPAGPTSSLNNATTSAFHFGLLPPRPALS
jgi:hypothetical protein